MKPDKVIHRLTEKAGAGHGGHANRADHPFAELQVRPALEAVHLQKIGNIHHHKIGALRRCVLQPHCIEPGQEMSPFPGVKLPEVVIVRRGKTQAHHRRFLKRRRRANGHKVVHFFGALNHRFRAYKVAKPPARDGIGF